MPVCEDARRPSRLLFVWIACWGFGMSSAAADFQVRDMQARFVNRSLVVTTQLDLTLSAKAEEALSKGIPLEVVMDFSLILHRSLLWDKEIADWSLRRRLQFHALSSQYIVSGLDPDAYEVESFASLQDALAYLGNLNSWTFPLTKKKKIDSGSKYSLKARIFLDIESLPSPLRPVAYTTPSWHHNSGWTQWTVSH